MLACPLHQGEVRGLIGPNGAGKSTLVNLISGLLRHSTGTISVNGKSVDNLSAHQRAHRGIARTFQNLRVFGSLTVQQNIDVAGYSGRAKTRDDETMIFCTRRLSVLTLQTNFMFLPVLLAYGQLRQMEIVRALALRPRLLMLDEPAAGMNEQETEDLREPLSWVQIAKRLRYSCY